MDQTTAVGSAVNVAKPRQELLNSKKKARKGKIVEILADHKCTPTNGLLAPTPVNLPVAAVAKPATYKHLELIVLA
ncbi:hypothetical protein CCACVL1_10893 [Corchorus capsularis]|uniref:Uncharacterized protein n=1 Tax=Corchorus capsularis TaxID=210143 RepID=A0A1R3IP12_COCAP|nr:hypothetical protein CCACVL1_10893 [Corchorus capsularis]